MFLELVNAFQVKADFSKFDTLEKYIALRNSLSTRYLETASKEVLLQIAKSIVVARPVVEVVENKTTPAKHLTKSQKRNKAKRAQQSKKVAVSVSTPPVEPVPAVDDPPFVKKRRMLMYPPGHKPDWCDKPKGVIKVHIQHMPIIEHLKMSEWSLNMVRRTKTGAQIEPAVHRSLLPNQYRASVGLHLVEEQCHLCEELASRNYLDDQDSRGSRIPSLVALHMWIYHGGDWMDFNQYYYPWFKDLVPDGPQVTDYASYSSYFSDYLKNKAWLTDGSLEMFEEWPAAEMLKSKVTMELYKSSGQVPQRRKKPPPYNQTMVCLSSSSSLKRKVKQ
jgi:hypothetical protein